MAEAEQNQGKTESTTLEDQSLREKEKSVDAESGLLDDAEIGNVDASESDEVLKPDGGWGWLVCLGAFICNFVVFGTNNSFGVIYGTLIKELNISSAETGRHPILGTPGILYPRRDYSIRLVLNTFKYDGLHRNVSLIILEH